MKITRVEFHNGTKLREQFGINLDQMVVLEKMNDHDGKSFAEIADYIEANL